MPTTVPDSHKDLTSAPVGSLSTLAADGSPQATLVWFIYDDEKFKLSLSTDRQKTRNLLKRPQVSLLIPDPQNPMRYLDVRGTASTEVDEDYAWVGPLAQAKYGADVRDFDKPGSTRLVVTIEPTNIYAAAVPG